MLYSEDVEVEFMGKHQLTTLDATKGETPEMVPIR